MKKFHYYLLVIFQLYGINIFAQFAGGTGTESDPWQIETLAHLDSVRNHLGDFFILMNDLDFDGSDYSNENSKKGWIPIGSSDSAFAGNLNGKGYVIKNLFINDTSLNNAGLFSVSNNATIDSLSLIEVYITGGDTIGALFGCSSESNITNCFVSGEIKGKKYVGGIVGYNGFTDISNVYSTVNVNAEERYAGGLAAYSRYSDFENCAATGNVVAKASYSGGLIGRTYAYGEAVRNCYATGSVKGNKYVGGLIGYNHNLQISNSYATGNVSGSSYYIAGFIGYCNNADSIDRCFSSGQVFAEGDNNGMFIGTFNNSVLKKCYYDDSKSGDLPAIYDEIDYLPDGLSASEMLTKDSFDNWDFESIWAIKTDTTYPVFRNLNNAPFAFSDTAEGTIKDLFNYNYDYETGKEYLVYKVDSIISATSGTNYTYNRNDIVNGDKLLISYRVGEYHSDLKDTLWGNQVTSLLEMENHAPVISSIVQKGFVAYTKYNYEVVATDKDGDQLYYTLQDAPEGMYIEGNKITWTLGEDVTSSGEITVVVSDGIFSDSKSFTINIVDETDVTNNKVDNNTIIYPNPVSDVLVINSNETINRLKVITQTGAVVLTTEVNYLEKQLNLEHLENGLYIVVLYTDNGVETHRIIKD